MVVVVNASIRQGSREEKRKGDMEDRLRIVNMIRKLLQSDLGELAKLLEKVLLVRRDLCVR